MPHAPSLTHAEYLNNLMYFIREGIKADDGCDYVIVVNQVSVDMRPRQP